MKKLFGYIFAGIGLIALAIWAIPGTREAIPFSGLVTDAILLIIAAAGILMGLFILYKFGKKKSKQPAEVPIYKGKEIVGYRQH